MTDEIKDLHDLLLDPLFPEIDTKLKAGWHCDEEEIKEFEFITRNLDKIEMFYELYGYEVLYATEGFYYLKPVSKEIKTYFLGMESMVVSQFLALMRMDPQYLEAAGYFDLQELLEKIELMLGQKQISRIFLKRKREKSHFGEQDAQNFSQSVKKSLRELSRYGFVSINPEFTRIYPRKPIFRFIDPIRELDDPKRALEQVVQGENPFVEIEEGEEINE